MRSLNFAGKTSSRKGAKPIAVLDCETDPFAPFRTIKPFAWGFYNGIIYKQFWGDNSTRDMLDYLKSLDESYQIFAHNGGRFDFMFFVGELRGNPLVINSRIVDADLYQHKISDSYARIPVALSRFGSKIEIDYDKMLRENREKHRTEITSYLKQDCLSLYEVIVAWSERFGRRDSTMASAAFKTANQRLGISSRNFRKTSQMSEAEDKIYRDYYYGGRVQAFAHGVIQDNTTMHDANSMYPFVMCEFKHPIGKGSAVEITSDIRDDTDFVKLEGWSKGALPIRTPEGLQFPEAYGTFSATIHEVKAGLETGRLKINRIIEARSFREKISFGDFIKPIYAERLEEKAAGNKMQVEFLKLLMNSTYGKYAQNPENYRDYMFTEQDAPFEVDDDGAYIDVEGRKFRLDCVNPGGKLWIARTEDKNGYKNVACAASITGAARATLFRALCQAEQPYYCDTDSVVSRFMPTSEDTTPLGAWKLEATASEIAIGGKKMYALWGDAANDKRERARRIATYKDEFCIKLASKGVRLTAPQMRIVASGGEVQAISDAPTFRMNGSYDNIKRRVRLTRPDLITPFPEPITPWDLRGNMRRIA